MKKYITLDFESIDNDYEYYKIGLQVLNSVTNKEKNTCINEVTMVTAVTR